LQPASIKLHITVKVHGLTLEVLPDSLKRFANPLSILRPLPSHFREHVLPRFGRRFERLLFLRPELELQVWHH
jgi:hypothetical protein